MYRKHLIAGNLPWVQIGLVLLVTGCSQSDNKSGQSQNPQNAAASKATATANAGPKHSGWWCDEHGVPEAMCGQCDARLAAEFQKKGDWCKEHDRPNSQCFLCRPELKEKFAAMYRAKYGKEPPPLEDEAKKDQKN